MASKAMMGGNMRGRMAGSGTSRRGNYRIGLSSSGSGRTRTVSQRKPYRARLARAGEA
jgi:hypothetical protein